MNEPPVPQIEQSFVAFVLKSLDDPRIAEYRRQARVQLQASGCTEESIEYREPTLDKSGYISLYTYGTRYPLPAALLEAERQARA